MNIINIIKKVYQTYETVNISKYEHIEVMDCQYDIKGFYPLNYEKVGEDAMIFLKEVSMEERITGVMIYYYFVCKRKLWYFCHDIQWKTCLKMRTFN